MRGATSTLDGLFRDATTKNTSPSTMFFTNLLTCPTPLLGISYPTQIDTK